MRVLVIGGSGYLGTLMTPFLARCYDLRVFDLHPPTVRDIEYVQGSVSDPEALASAVVGMEAVLYMAMGSHPHIGGDHAPIKARVSAFDVNVKGLHLALYAAASAGVGHAVYTSSMSVYSDKGVGRDGAVEGTPPDATDVYGFTKRLGEEVCRNACRAWGMSVNALRLYLPVPETRWMAEAGKGAPTPWTTAEDTARALLAALEYRGGFQAFTISGDYEQSLLCLTKAKRLLGWEPLARPSQQR
jgi:nucleoside-diphosphate-sugar epimerase